jgi:hypothetical protein
VIHESHLRAGIRDARCRRPVDARGFQTALAELAGSKLALALIYFAGAKIGVSIAVVAPQVTTVWPTGIALAASFLLGSRAWPGIALGGARGHRSARRRICGRRLSARRAVTRRAAASFSPSTAVRERWRAPRRTLYSPVRRSDRGLRGAAERLLSGDSHHHHSVLQQ